MYRSLSAFAVLALCACASAQAPVVRYSGHSESFEAREARLIEAARRHPNAQPRVRPLYPEQAPPPLPAGTSLPPPMYVTRRSAPYPDYPASTSFQSEREDYPASAWSYRYGYGRPRYGFGLSYGYGYPYSWDPYAYGYYSPSYRYGYGASWWGPRHHYSSGFGHSYRYHLGSPGYHLSAGFSSFGHGGHSFHAHSVGGGGGRHRH